MPVRAALSQVDAPSTVSGARAASAEQPHSGSVTEQACVAGSTL